MYNKLLNTFIAVADCGSFSKASKKLYTTVVTVMNQINSLEKHLGFSLFERTNHGVILTEAGTSIYKDAKQIIKISDKAIERGKIISGTKSKIIRIGTSMLRPCKPLIDIWNKINDNNSSFQIQIIPFQDEPDIIRNILDSLGQDIDFIIGPCVPSKSIKKYNFLSLGVSKCCIAVSKKHELSSKSLLTWDDIQGENLILIKRGESLIIDNIRNDIEINHPDIHIVDTPTIYNADVFNKCEQHNYIMETLDIWQDIHPSLVTIPMDWEYEVPYGVLYAEDSSQSVIDFINLIKKSNTSI